MTIAPDTKTCADCGTPTQQRFARYCADHRWRHRGKPAKYLWTPEKDAFMRAKYDSRQRGRAAKIAALWGWPHWVVKKRAQQLGIARPTWLTGRRPWTPEEEARLERHAGVRHPQWIAKQLGRSITSVVVKLKRLRLSRCPEGLNQLAVAEAFGCSRDTVERWQRQGWLVASHPSTQPGVRHGITDDDLRTFIRTHPTAFDLRSVDQPWFLDLVLGTSPVTFARHVKANSPDVTRAFLDVVRETGNASTAAAAVNVSRTRLYTLLREDARFRQQYEEARGLKVMAKAQLRETPTDANQAG